jgi:Icc protein
MPRTAAVAREIKNMSSAEHNKTRTSANGCLRVVQITDTHLFGDARGRLVGMNTEETSLEVLSKVVAEAGPLDLVLATGDIVHDGSEIGYRRFKERFERLAVPTLVIPGNHDKPEVLDQVMQGGHVRREQHLLLGNWQFVMLDSSAADRDGGHLAPAQLALLERQLAAYPSHHAMVCLHHHPVSVGSRWIDTIGVDNADEFFAIVDRFPQVRVILWGHIHQDFRARRNGVELLASPSTCIQFRPGQAEFGLDDMPPGYRWLNLYADGRIETGVERAEARVREVDLQSGGYT